MLAMGGPMGAYDEAGYPWLAAEKRWIAAAAAGTPYFGGVPRRAAVPRASARRCVPGIHPRSVCAGRGDGPRAGRPGLRRTRRPVSGPAVAGDTFAIPSGAVHLGRLRGLHEPGIPVRCGRVRVQFHVEVTDSMLAEWRLVPHTRSRPRRLGKDGSSAGRGVRGRPGFDGADRRGLVHRLARSCGPPGAGPAARSPMTEVAFFELADPGFSVTSDEVHRARESCWYAHTSYGLAVLRHDQASRLIRHPSLRQGSPAWPGSPWDHLWAVRGLVGGLGAQQGGGRSSAPAPAAEPGVLTAAGRRAGTAFPGPGGRARGLLRRAGPVRVHGRVR